MEMSNYCAAYEARNFRKYPGWTENAANVRKEKQEVGGKEVEVDRQLDDDSILYLHDSYIVTDGIYKDENVIYDNVNDEWKQFCHETLGFEIPVYEPIEIPHAPEAESQAAPEAESQAAPEAESHAAPAAEPAPEPSSTPTAG